MFGNSRPRTGPEALLQALPLLVNLCHGHAPTRRIAPCDAAQKRTTTEKTITTRQMVGTSFMSL